MWVRPAGVVEVVAEAVGVGVGVDVGVYAFVHVFVVEFRVVAGVGAGQVGAGTKPSHYLTYPIPTWATSALTTITYLP